MDTSQQHHNTSVTNTAANNDADKHTHTPRHPHTRLHPEWLFLHDQLPPSQWYAPDYAYKTSSWLNVHTGIRKRQRILRQLSEDYQEGRLEWDRFRSQVLKRINQHVLKLHQHHSVEDLGYFPEFVSSYPQLKQGFEILGRDHVRLDGLLDELQRMSDQMSRIKEEDKVLAEQIHHTLHHASDFLSQHLTDEEDLVIPILGLRQS